MTVLSDRSIREALDSERLRLDDWSGIVGPASIDLHLSDSWARPNDKNNRLIFGKGLELPPLTFCLASTVETIHLSSDLCAQVAGCSSIGRSGLQIECAGWVDPGFSGQITVELFNMLDVPIFLTPGQRICQIVFMEMTTPVDRPYGSPGVGRYQGQVGATPARSSRRLCPTTPDGTKLCVCTTSEYCELHDGTDPADGTS